VNNNAELMFTECIRITDSLLVLLRIIKFKYVMLTTRARGDPHSPVVFGK